MWIKQTEYLISPTKMWMKLIQSINKPGEVSKDMVMRLCSKMGYSILSSGSSCFPLWKLLGVYGAPRLILLKNKHLIELVQPTNMTKH